MVITFSAQIARIREEVEHLLNSPFIEAAISDGDIVEFSFEMWTKDPDNNYRDRIEYVKEIIGAEEAE